MTAPKTPRPAPAGQSRPCTHQRVYHEHGTYNRAQCDGCRCPSCTRAIRRRRKQYQMGLKPDVAPLVPAARVAEHLAQLRAAGVTHREVAARVGKSYSAIRRYAYLRRGRVRFDSVKEIMAIPVPEAPVAPVVALGMGGGDGYVDAVGSRRRLQALAVMGWPLWGQARRMGMSTAALSDIRLGHVTTVRARTAATIAAWYRYMVTHPPMPHERSAASDARTRRVGAGWVGPMAWDQGTIDDPQARPWEETSSKNNNDVDGAAVGRGKEMAA
ncbi:hypothetical protein NSA19_03840 [Actinomyces bowdenii]|uniref:helix-turn-helix domain-containing protein n=1 Tax=Actinomyces bowdenii TaxID=131109 RepID=UPI00214BF0B4|nr:hypothetical protein [Actinomyces bowdenii]MCR2051999.1 hypothetical protein [Actinomyces bowdenii]